MLVIAADDVDFENKQDAAFYTWPGTTNVAVVKHEGRTVYVDCVGEMYLCVPNVPEGLDLSDPEVYNYPWDETVIRYTDQLQEIGVRTDADLAELDRRFSSNGYEIWHMNSWFEVWSPDDEFGYDAFHSISEALDFAKKCIVDNEYWETLDTPAEI